MHWDTVNDQLKNILLRLMQEPKREKILENFVDFSIADQDPDPICLKEKEWAFIKEDFETATNPK